MKETVKGAVGDLLKGNAKPEDLKQQGKDLPEGTFRALRFTRRSMSLANLVTQYVVQYGFRIMGAMLVIVAAPSWPSRSDGSSSTGYTNRISNHPFASCFCVS